MVANKLQWKRIAKGEKLPCQSFLRKKDGEILKLSTIGGVTVGQDAYYIPVDEVIEEIRNYPIEESEDEKIIKEIKQFIRSRGMSLAQSKVDSWIAWLEKQDELTDIPADAVLDSNKDGLIADTIRYKREKQCEQKPAWSEEDREYMKSLLDVINGTPSLTPSEVECHKDWLKSLKNRFTWKPSKRQIQSIRNCALNKNIDAGTRLALDALYQDLLKLREE